jgi:glutathione-regulated potassium-efflux system ancillary protein KefC
LAWRGDALEAIWIAVAYLLGLTVSYLKVPPLVGYLAGGLALFGMGATASELLHDIGHLGVLLLLFTIGLHLRFRSILRLEVLGAGSLQLIISAILFTAAGLAFGLDITAAVILAIALGFSSTVLAAKTLEARSELEAYHGRIAIGILILQDIVAIVLLAFSGLGAPSPWALLLLLIPLARPLLLRLLAASRHDELLLLYGLLLALGSGALFESLGLSGELGAVAAGALLAGHPQADELAEKLWGLKEAFLVAFFLEIGLAGVPSIGGIVLALGLLLFLPLRTMLYFFLMVALKLRARTGFMVGISLTSYSEFALIAGAPAASAGLIPESALLVLALTVVLSFVVGAPLNRVVHPLYSRLESRLVRFERPTDHPDETPRLLGSARSLVFGMGRTGLAAYNALTEQGKRPVGLDSDPGKIEHHRREGLRVLYGDAEDPELWEQLDFDRLDTVILTVPDFEARLHAVEGLRSHGFGGVISTLSMFPEEEEPLREAGADIIAHPLSEAGTGLVEQSLRLETG